MSSRTSTSRSWVVTLLEPRGSGLSILLNLIPKPQVPNQVWTGFGRFGNWTTASLAYIHSLLNIQVLFGIIHTIPSLHHTLLSIYHTTLIDFLFDFLFFSSPRAQPIPYHLWLHTEHSHYLQSYPSLPNTLPCGSTPLPTQILIKLATEPLMIHSHHGQTNGYILDHLDSMLNVEHQHFRNFILFYFGLYLEFSVSQLLFFSLPQVTFYIIQFHLSPTLFLALFHFYPFIFQFIFIFTYIHTFHQDSGSKCS